MNIYASDQEGMARRQAIVDLVRARAIHNQKELAGLLRRRGYEATQATLSRDLRSLGIGKVPGREGARYVLSTPAHEVMDETQKRLEIGAFVLSAEVIGTMVLVRTPPGNAHGVARALDLLDWPEIAGTIAGDDTILVVSRSTALARSVHKRLGEAIGRSLR
jgi:transcriptional regulator of arginine metabolism